jgi:hypothetical protein
MKRKNPLTAIFQTFRRGKVLDSHVV